MCSATCHPSLIIYAFPFIAAFIGWIFNKILLSYFFGKIIPKLKLPLSETVAKYVADEVDIKDIAQHIARKENIESLKPSIEKHLDNLLRVKLEEKIPMISMLMGEKTIDKLKQVAMEELDVALPSLILQLGEHLQSTTDINKLVKEKMMNLDMQKIIPPLKKSLRKQLNYFELAGAVCGLIIGIVLIAFLIFNF